MILVCPACRRDWPLAGKREGETWNCLCGAALVTPVPRPFHAPVWHCGSCGAGLPVHAKSCDYCGTGLKPLDGKAYCARCMAYLEQGALFCSHCGSHALATDPLPEATAWPCPRCAAADGTGTECLVGVPVGLHHGKACPRCEGLWLETAVFARVVQEYASPENQGVPGTGLLGSQVASPGRQPVGRNAKGAPGISARGQAPAGPSLSPSGFEEKVRYLPCPVCKTRMARQNYLRVSGILVDTCPEHGIWLDRDELRRVAVFLRQGGVLRSQKQEREEAKAQARHRHDIEDARRELAARGGGLGDSVNWPGAIRDGSAFSLTDFVVDLFRAWVRSG